MVELHIPEHNCDMHKIVVAIYTQSKKGTTHFQCTVCNNTWDESKPILKSICFEVKM